MMNLVEGFLILICVLITIIGASFCLVCVGICFKIYSELMKEHTIRKRYETQGKGKMSLDEADQAGYERGLHVAGIRFDSQNKKANE